jgi:hypothetical protein
MNNDSYFDGVFAALKRRFGDDLLSQEVIKITASSSLNMTVAVLLDPEPTKYFGTHDKANSWIMIDFHTMSLSLTGYAFRTHSDNGNGHIRGWVIEGRDKRNEQCEWKIVEQRVDVNSFESIGRTAYFKLAENSPYYRMFRIRQTQTNTLGWNTLRLSQIEFFGCLQTEGSIRNK